MVSCRRGNFDAHTYTRKAPSFGEITGDGWEGLLKPSAGPAAKRRPCPWKWRQRALSVALPAGRLIGKDPCSSIEGGAFLGHCNQANTARKTPDMTWGVRQYSCEGLDIMRSHIHASRTDNGVSRSFNRMKRPIHTIAECLTPLIPEQVTRNRHFAH